MAADNDARSKIDDVTDAAIDAEAGARDVDRAEIIREILHAWGHKFDRAHSLFKKRRKAQGQDGADEGTIGRAAP